MEPLEIDGSAGGGQILRSALSLAALTGKPFAIRDIRGRRPRPGLMRQHLTAVRAAAAVCGAQLRGDELGSRELGFWPGPVRAGELLASLVTDADPRDRAIEAAKAIERSRIRFANE